MATRQVLKEEFLTCIICHEVFRDPVTLHCGHTLCAQCLTEYTKTQKDALHQGCLSCPHCRGMTKVPDPKKPVEEWTGQFKTGFFVKGLVEKFSLEEAGDDDSCSLCKEDGAIRPASVWCSDCGHALCSECQKVHRKLQKSHEVTDITGESDRPVMGKPRKAVCQKHPEFVIDLVCEDCNLAICQRCTTLQHRKCESVILLEDALCKVIPVLQEQKKQVDKEVTKGQSDVSDLTSLVEIIQRSAAQVEAEINSATEKLITKIREKQEQLKEELTQRKEETLERLKADIKCQKMRIEENRQRQSFGVRTVVTTSTQSRCIKSFSTHDDMVTFRDDTPYFHDVVYDVTKISDTEAATCLYSKKQIVFFKVEPQLTLERKVQTKRNYFGLTCLNSSTIGALNSFPGRVDIIDMSGRILRTFDADILSQPGQGYITAVDNNRLLVSDRHKRQTVMFNHQGKIQFSYHHGYGQAGVCQGRSGMLFFVDTEQVCQLSESGEFVCDVITNVDGLTIDSALFVDGKFMYFTVHDRYICIYQYLP